QISEARGRYMKEAGAAEAGAMAAVDAAPDTLASLLESSDVVIANLNSPRQTVLSGPREHIEEALVWCRERNLAARMLPVACAFHSPHVGGAQQRLARLLAHATVAVPQVPVYSNTTGEAHAQNATAIAELLSEHLIRPVEFVRELEAMYRDGARVFVEVGPRSVLTGLVAQTLGDRDHLAVPMDGSGHSGLLSLLHCLAAVAREGVPLDLERLLRGRPPEGLDPPSSGRMDSWLVDGGRAWPAAAPRPSTTPIPVSDQEDQTAMITTSTNGGGSLAPD